MQGDGNNPVHGNTASADVGQLLDRARAHHQEGDFELAETLYRQILETDPHHPEALHSIGVIAHQAGNDLTRSDIHHQGLGA